MISKMISKEEYYNKEMYQDDPFKYWANMKNLDYDIYMQAVVAFDDVKEAEPGKVKNWGELKTLKGIALYYYKKEMERQKAKEEAVKLKENGKKDNEKEEQDMLLKQQILAKYLKENGMVVQNQLALAEYMKKHMDMYNNENNNCKRSSMGR